MQCKQKLCNRSKNLETSGNCCVCENVMKEVLKEFEKKNKQVSGKVEVDVNLMVKIHEELSRGIPVDKDVVSNLLLGGIINILNQHDTIDDLDERIKAVENMTLTDKLRIESFEDWAQKQAKNINNLEDQVSNVIENASKVNDISERTDKLELEFNKSKILKGDITNDRIGKQEVVLNCEHCDCKFGQAISLENHMEEHGLVKSHPCEVCGKDFHLKWRLKKHMQNHDACSDVPYCHYYNNNKRCPYFKVGCMYKHESSGRCKSVNCKRQMCPYEHEEIMDVEEDEEVREQFEEQVKDLAEDQGKEQFESQDKKHDDDVDEDEAQVECIMCECTFLDNYELDYHMKTAH